MQGSDWGKVAAGAVLAAGLMIGATAHATDYIVIPGTAYAGLAGDGNSGTDAFGNPWTWNTTVGGVPGPGAGFSAWGTPGLGDGDAIYGGSTPADAFFISFVVDHTGATFNQTPSTTPGGYTELTRMTVNGIAWTPVFLDSSNEVDFYAPAGVFVDPGQTFFVNIIFNQKNISGANVGFSAAWATAVPEAPAWAMMIVGIAGIGGTMRLRRNQRTAVA
jgi:hypothetical protein